MADNCSSEDVRETKKNVVVRVDNKEYQEDNDIALSDIDEDQRKELLSLELQIDSENLTRGERRRLQNKRNVLKAKIKKELETENHKSKISKLQKKVIQMQREVKLSAKYKSQRNTLREQNLILQEKIQKQRK